MGLTVLNRQRKMLVPLDDIRERLQRIYDVSGARGRDVTVVLLSDAGIRRLNARFRNIREPTDCLSFPDDDPVPGDSDYLGDIAISVESALCQSGAVSPRDRAFLCEVERLFVHSLLHLAGFDHTTAGEERAMRAKEYDLLRAARAGATTR